MYRILLSALCLPLLGQTPELRSTAVDRKSLSITIYQNGLAAVRDTRRVELPAGKSTLAFADLAAKIRSKSAYLLDPAPGLATLERNFEFNLLSPTSLKLTGLGQPVALRDGRTGELQWGTQRSLPYPHGLWNIHATAIQKMARMRQAWIVQPTESVLIQQPDGVTASGGQSPIYERVPSTLRTSPTLLQTLQSPATGPQDLTLLYTTEGLSWQAHYIATLDPDAKHLDLDAFATVENRSGIAYPEAAFQLIAGEPHIVSDPDPRDESQPPEIDATQTTVEVAGSIAGPPVFHEEKLSEYPLFTLDRPVTLLDGQKKQLALFRARRVPLSVQAVVCPGLQWFENVQDSYLDACAELSEPTERTDSPIPLWLDLYEGGPKPGNPVEKAAGDRISARFLWEEDHRPAVQLEGRIQNAKGHGLGRSLPAGSLDLRYTAPGGLCIPMDEMQVDQTPSGESMRLDLGTARGFFASRRVVSLQRVEDSGGLVWEMEVEVVLTNTSRRPMKTLFREPIFQDWTLEHSNLPGERSGENAYDFTFISKPGSRFAFRYKVKTAPKNLPKSS